jgi:hypothetical protein
MGNCVMLFHDGRVKRFCIYCGKPYRPHVADQRFCGPYCRANGKAAEGRAARRAWWAAGRPMFEETDVEQKRKEA